MVALLLCFFSLLCTNLTFADTIEPQPERSDLALWELGLLGGIVETPDYAGSNEQQIRWLVFPNFRYRGKILRSDQNEGTRARLNDNPYFRWDMSFGGSFPADSNSNDARRGMPDLDFTLSLGPRLKVRFLDQIKRWGIVELVIPLRLAYTIDFTYFNMQDRGFVFSPGVQWRRRKIFCADCEIFFRLASGWATERFHDLFYQVDPAFATPDRPFYDAQAGLNSIQYFTGYALRINKVQAFLGINYSDYSLSKNRDSPLFRQDWNTTIIFGLGWLFWESDERGYN